MVCAPFSPTRPTHICCVWGVTHTCHGGWCIARAVRIMYYNNRKCGRANVIHCRLSDLPNLQQIPHPLWKISWLLYQGQSLSVVRIFKELQKELNLYSALNYHPWTLAFKTLLKVKFKKLHNLYKKNTNFLSNKTKIFFLKLMNL